MPEVLPPVSTRDLVHVALFAAIIAALGLIPPLTLGVIPVPITAQSLGVMLAGAILGARRGALAVLVFLVLIAIGLPLLAGGRGGLGVFFGPSGGFVFGFPVAAFVIGLLIERFWEGLGFFRAFIAIVAGGIGAMYLLGVPWLAAAAGLTLTQAITGSAAFLPGDLIKAAVAALIAVTIKRAYPVIQPAGHAGHR
jgi:biotin transport system substrate-specific component